MELNGDKAKVSFISDVSPENKIFRSDSELTKDCKNK